MTAPAARSTAAKRRTELLAAAITEFAVAGLHGTSTEAIAQRAGISHAYLFRLYGTKKQLFVACCERCFERTLETFTAAANGATPMERLESMGQAYTEMLANRELLLPDIRDVARRGFQMLRTEVARLSGSTGAELYDFFARGMLINVAASMDFPDLSDPKCW